MACKPGSVPLARGWPFIWEGHCCPPHATYPDDGGNIRPAQVSAETDLCALPPLFGLAPGGVFRASPVTSPAVGSYPTFSPLPRRIRAVCFLWHFPSDYSGWPLTSTACSRSPDFPHLPLRANAAIRPSGRGYVDYLPVFFNSHIDCDTAEMP